MMLLAKHSVQLGLLGPSVLPEIDFKGHWNCALLVLFFLKSMCSEDSV